MKRKKSFLPDDCGDFEHGLDKIDEQIKIVNHCPVCNTRFGITNSRLVAEQENGHLVYLSCKKCENSVVAMVHFGSHGITSMGMVTDLSYDDVLRVKDGDLVTADDAIEAHECLQRQDWIKLIQ